MRRRVTGTQDYRSLGEKQGKHKDRNGKERLIEPFKRLIERWELTDRSGLLLALECYFTSSTVTLGSGKNYQQMLSQEEKFFIKNRIYVWSQNMSPKPTHQQQGEKLENTLTRWTLSASRCNIWKGNITLVIFCLWLWNLKLNCEETSDLNGDHSI